MVFLMHVYSVLGTCWVNGFGGFVSGKVGGQQVAAYTKIVNCPLQLYSLWLYCVVHVCCYGFPKVFVVCWWHVLGQCVGGFVLGKWVGRRLRNKKEAFDFPVASV